MNDPLLPIKQKILELSGDHQRSLLQWLQVQLEEEGEGDEAIPVSKNRQVVDTRKQGQIIYRQELVRCGKPTCKCSEGQLHGPYWYAYQRVGGKVKSSYVGKALKEEGGGELGEQNG